MSRKLLQSPCLDCIGKSTSSLRSYCFVYIYIYTYIYRHRRCDQCLANLLLNRSEHYWLFLYLKFDVSTKDRSKCSTRQVSKFISLLTRLKVNESICTYRFENWYIWDSVTTLFLDSYWSRIQNRFREVKTSTLA